MHTLVGYISGDFDLFHVGHLDLLRQAKRRCDRLIVGVRTDEAVERDRGARPFVRHSERMEIVRHVRYVDEVRAVDGDDDDAVTALARKHGVGVVFRTSPGGDDVDPAGVTVIRLREPRDTQSWLVRTALHAAPGASVA